jgi:hypothetical protein
MDAEDQEQEKNASKGALKITIHVLKSNEPERVCKTHWKKVRGIYFNIDFMPTQS